MCRSASRSRSAVDTPGSRLSSTSGRTSATIRPAERIFAMSAWACRLIMSARHGGDARVSEDVVDPQGDGGDGLLAVDRMELACLPVVIDDLRQGAELLVHPCPNGVRPVVGALVQLGAVQVADAGDPRRAPDLVVGVPRRAADPAAREALDEVLHGHVHEDGRGDARVPAFEGAVQRVGLDGGAREPVEDDAPGGVIAAEPFEQEADGDVVGNELPRVHVSPRFRAQLRTVADGGAEQVPGGDHRDPEPVREQRRLRALAGTGGTEQDHHVHRMKPSYCRMSSWASSCFIVSTTTDTTIRMLVPPRARSLYCGDSRPMSGGSAATVPRNRAPATVIRVTT